MAATLNQQNQPKTQSAIVPTDQVRPAPDLKIQWASTEDLELESEIMNSRRWLSEELIASSCKHWNCSRKQAMKNLIHGLDECSA